MQTGNEELLDEEARMLATGHPTVTAARWVISDEPTPPIAGQILNMRVTDGRGPA